MTPEELETLLWQSLAGGGSESNYATDSGTELGSPDLADSLGQVPGALADLRAGRARNGMTPSGARATTPRPTAGGSSDVMASGGYSPAKIASLRAQHLASQTSGGQVGPPKPSMSPSATSPTASSKGSLRYSQGNNQWRDYNPEAATREERMNLGSPAGPPSTSPNVSIIQGSDDQQRQMALNTAMEDTALAEQQQKLTTARMSPEQRAQIIASSRAKSADPIKTLMMQIGIPAVQGLDYGSMAKNDFIKQYREKYKADPSPQLIEAAGKRGDPGAMLAGLIALFNSINSGRQDVTTVPSE